MTSSLGPWETDNDEMIAFPYSSVFLAPCRENRSSPLFSGDGFATPLTLILPFFYINKYSNKT